MRRAFLVLVSAVLAAGGVICGVIAHPEPLFAHVMSGKMLRVYSDEPIDEEGGRAFIGEAEALLAKWPFAHQQRVYRVFVANSSWRRLLLFTYNFGSGGVAYCVISGRNAFLSGADFSHGRLMAPSGAVMPPPRTLAYYSAHEVTHLLTGEQVGAYGFVAMPVWISEGIADYVALDGARDFASLVDA